MATTRKAAGRMMRIGVIADTHGRFDSTLFRHFAGVDHILHAGDIGDREVIRQLERIAPVTAVSGNVDGFARGGYPEEHVIVLGGWSVALRHIVYEGRELNPLAEVFLDRVRPDLCVFGHTHRPHREWRGDVLLFNPGSAGPQRFNLPRAVGLLLLGPDGIDSTHRLLSDRMGTPGADDGGTPVRPVRAPRRSSGPHRRS